MRQTVRPRLYPQSVLILASGLSSWAHLHLWDAWGCLTAVRASANSKNVAFRMQRQPVRRATHESAEPCRFAPKPNHQQVGTSIIY